VRGLVEPVVRGWWVGSGGFAGRMVRALAFPAELAFRAGSAVRNRAYDKGTFRVHSLPVPVVSVGNLVVGGTGKTPVSSWLAKELVDTGHRPAILARGYGRDEIELHRKWTPNVPVRADRDRVRAGTQAIDDGADVLVLDDGFQHRRLARDLDLVLVAAEQTFPGRLLPAGPYREPPEALRRAHAVLVTHRVGDSARAHALVSRIEEAFPQLLVGTLHLAASGWQDLEGVARSTPEGGLLAVTSVARPDDFERLVADMTGARPVSLAFPDHYEFSSKDVDLIRKRAGERAIVTTEKDAVKLVRFADSLPPVHVLTLLVRPGPGAAEVLERVWKVASFGVGPGRTASVEPPMPQRRSP
jgi:tetraacyldisaccharide 4'-kinase